MPNIIGEPIPVYLANQINTRQKIHGLGTPGSPRDSKSISYLNSRTAWIKLASGITITKDRLIKEGLDPDWYGSSLASNFILFGGTSKFSVVPPLKIGILSQRGTPGSSTDNLWNSLKGVYNVNGNASGDSATGEFGLVPMPGITSMELKCLNRGSIKKVTVNLKCYSPEQFKVLNLLYLRLGYTLLLEWGWSMYLDNNENLISDYLTLTESEFFVTTPKESNHLSFLYKSAQLRAKHFGNCDSLLCKVSNFNWTFQQDGSYDIQLTLISLGDVVESLKCNITPSYALYKLINLKYALYTEEEGTDEDIKPTPIKDTINAYLFLQKLYLTVENNPNGYTPSEIADIPNSDVWCTINNNKINLSGRYIIPPDSVLDINKPIYDYSPTFLTAAQAQNWVKTARGGAYASYPQATGRCHVIVDESGNCDCGPNAWSLYTEKPGESYDYYVVVKTTPNLTALPGTSANSKSDNIYLNYNTGNDTDKTLSDDGFYMRLGHLLQYINENVIPKHENTLKPLFTINCGVGGNYMYLVPYQVSFDPRVCIVGAVQISDPGGYTNVISAFATRIGDPGDNEKTFFPKLDGFYDVNRGLTMNIYLNHKQIRNSIDSNLNDKGDLSVFDFVQDLCVSINKALGGVNNLEVIYNEATNQLQLIDSSYSYEDPSKVPYQLELYGYNGTNSNFVHDFDLKTEITNEFATMVTVGATAGGYVKGTENTMFSKWNKGLVDRFNTELVPGDPNTRDTGTSTAEANLMYEEKIWRGNVSAFGLTPFAINDDDWVPWNTKERLGLNDEIIDQNLAIVTEFYKYYHAQIQNSYDENYASPTNGFIPISLGVTMEGISGIKIYNAIEVDTRFLPSDYPEALQFIIKGVNHSVKDGKWETSIETVVIAQNKDLSVATYDPTLFTTIKNS